MRRSDLLALGALLLNACAGGGSSPPPPPTQTVLDQVNNTLIDNFMLTSQPQLVRK